MITYTAAIGTVSNVVKGDFCDVVVAENDVVGYREDDDGNEIPEYAMGSTIVLPAIETGVRTGGDVNGVQHEADQILWEHDYRRVGPWEASDNALYAKVERL